MKRICLLSFIFSVTTVGAQTGESPIRTFGYFQTSFQHWTTLIDQSEHNSFSLQQLNLFFQKDLSSNWSAFLNFEFLNNFSSSRQWGAANLEEAWVKYRLNMMFNLKLGLQIPVFNNLNDIKNRTPLLPYIVRPLVYETSFNEFFDIEAFAPARAFAQVYGFFPVKNLKLDYAVYVGNSSNLNNDPEKGQTGVDTTTAFLVGGRIGIRKDELKAGLSFTYEKTDEFQYLAEVLGEEPQALRNWPKHRLGGDLSYNFRRFSMEGEFIQVRVDQSTWPVDFAIDFYYATLGYYLSDRAFLYGTYWFLDADAEIQLSTDQRFQEDDTAVRSIGVAYNLSERIRLKAQVARVRNETVLELLGLDLREHEKDKFSVAALAVSVYF